MVNKSFPSDVGASGYRRFIWWSVDVEKVNVTQIGKKVGKKKGRTKGERSAVFHPYLYLRLMTASFSELKIGVTKLVFE